MQRMQLATRKRIFTRRQAFPRGRETREEMEMPYLLGRRAANAQRRVTPDEAQADALARKRAALDYVPANGFHKDRKQDRIEASMPATRWQMTA